MLVLVAGLVLVAAIAVGGYFGGKAAFGSGDEREAAPAAPAPRIVLRKPKEQRTADLGFPAFATKNTTRVGGTDPVADAAGVALAVYPSTGGVDGPAAVSLVPAESWQDAIAAASLTAPPIGAPILIGADQGMPAITAEALRALSPGGEPITEHHGVFALGAVSAPTEGTKRIPGRDPAVVAATIARLRERLTGQRPAHIVIASLDNPAYAMPAAAWAARSGDPVLFAGKGAPPVATLRTLHRYAGVPTYVLGPEAAVSARAFGLIRKVEPQAKRIGGGDPVANSIAFARYFRGDFGWDINDPGHGLVLASDARPLDAGAAAALSASGTWGPLLVTTSATELPGALRNYLLDIKPGYLTNPTRAVYNHVWVIGDAASISVGVQAEIDDLAELAKVRSGSGGGIAPPAQP